ncbi:MAG: LacI family DNA-binding transcriptional regulator [bacterium]
MKRPTMSDVARLASVSNATVSAVLNDSAAVKDSTRLRVLTAIEQLNYRASPTGSSANTSGSRSLGFLIKEIDNPYYAEVVLGAREVAEQHGYSLFVATSEGEYDSERRAVEQFRGKGIEGLIFAPILHTDTDSSHLFELKRRNYPFVLIEGVSGLRASLIDVDNTDASRDAVQYLIRRGHTRIVHLSGPPYSLHSQERIEGVRRACSSSGILFPDESVIPAGAHLADGYEAGKRYFGACPAESRPTAVTCYNDLVAIGLCRALAELELRVPENVSIIGWDDIVLAAYLPVPLTTVQMPKSTMGAIAAEMLIRQVESHQSLPPQHAVLSATLVERSSVRDVGLPCNKGQSSLDQRRRGVAPGTGAPAVQ